MNPTSPDPATPVVTQSTSVSGSTMASTETSEASQQTFIAGVSSPGQLGVASPSPTAFGRYEVRRTLGEGSFGTVYLGHDDQLDRPVAIKVLRLGPDVLQSATDRLLHEARKLARLNHPGIVTVHDVGTHEGQMFIVSNYLDGEELAASLAKIRPSWQESAVIVAAICDALAHAHANLTVHRDVKPANIILTSNRAPVLVDFGLALDDSSAGGHELGLVAGTPAYMAPEQISGTAHRIDGRTDIYSLGVVLYEMLCQRMPFRSTDTVELLRQVRDDEPQPLRQLAQDIPPELERICLKAMAKKMQDRYVTAADFAEDLRRVIQSASASSHVYSIQQPTTDTSAEFPSGSTQYRPATSPSTRYRLRAAERRQVTVLVCGSAMFEDETYLALDAEDQAKILRAFRHHCEHVVSRLDGSVVQCNEQGLLASFGYPVAYEDAAERAARTGLAFFDAMPTLADQFRGAYRVELNAWVAIHTGQAVVETKDDTVSLVGEARNVALRLVDSAAPGHVICTEDTQRLIHGRFHCANLGERRIKGVARPVELFHIQRISESRSVVETAAGTGLSPLSGRDLEVSLLKERWEQAQEGLGQVVLLSGEPGLGKSRLVYTLKEHVLGETVEGELDTPVIEWRCSPQFQNTRFYPAIDFYERALAIDREEPRQARFDRLLRHLEQLGLAHPETVPLWASLLSLPTPDQFPPLSLSPIRQREETFRAMLDWLHTRAAQRPVLFVVEDLHWVDASTLEFLGKLFAECQDHRILTVLTCRPEFKAPWPTAGHHTSLSLNRLTRRQAAELIQKRAGGVLPEALIAQIYDRTGGVPLFVEEFTKMIQESGAMLAGASGDSPSSSLLSREIPATLQDLISARLDRMEGAHELAQFAATLGREFSHELLAAVASIDEATLESELDKLARSEILFRKGRPPKCSYLFKHALLEDSLYNSLVKDKRQGFHRRIAEVLETQFPQTAESRPELLAHHFTEAGSPEKAVGFWLQAGMRSRQQSADVEAVGHLRQGLTLLSTLTETPSRDLQELQFVTTLGPALIAVQGYAAPEVGPVLSRARELCEQGGDVQQLFGIMLGMWEWRLVQGNLPEAVELALDGMQLANRLNDPGLLLEALFMEGTTLFYRGRFDSSRICHERALAKYEDRERTKFWTGYSGHNASVTQRNYLALDLWHLGLPEEAARIDCESRDLARSIGHAFSLGHAVDFTAFLGLCGRNGSRVLSAAEEEIAIGNEHGFQLWQALGTLHKGAGMFLLGRREDALPVLVQGFQEFRATGAEIRVPAYLGFLGDVYTQLGRFDDAHHALDEGLAVAEKNDDRCHEAELQRLQGELLLAEALEQSAAAEDWFRRAIHTACAQRSRAWELRATMSLARLWRQQGSTKDARDALAAVYGAFTEGLATPDLVDAAALLKALS